MRRPTAVAFLEALIQAIPYRLHTILTDNGIQFADLPRNRDGWTARYRVHRFDQICRENGIEHRSTKPNHPWTNGQVERMNRTIKGLTPYEYICKIWTKEPDRFNLDPIHQMPGLNT